MPWRESVKLCITERRLYIRVARKIEGPTTIYVLTKDANACRFLCLLTEVLFSQILRFHFHAIYTALKNKLETIQWKKPRKWNVIKDWYTNNLSKSQVFPGQQFLSYLLKHFTHLCRTLYGDAILLVFSITPFKIDKKNQNRSIDKVSNLGNEMRYIYKDPRQDSGQRNISNTRYPKKCFTQTY